MDQATHDRTGSFIWGIADDVWCDPFRRGKCPDVTLPMGVLRCMDAVLEPTKRAMLDTGQILEAVNWRVEAVPPGMAKIHKLAHKPGKLTADILVIEKEAEGLLDDLLVEATQP